MPIVRGAPSRTRFAGIERSYFDSAVADRQQHAVPPVAEPGIHGGRLGGEQLRRLRDGAIHAADIHATVIIAHRDDVVEEVDAVRQKGRPAVRDHFLRSIEDRHRRRVATLIGDAHQRRVAILGLEHNHARSAPRAAARIGCIGEHDRRAAVEGDSLQFATREKPDRLTVRRPEWVARAFGPRAPAWRRATTDRARTPAARPTRCRRPNRYAVRRARPPGPTANRSRREAPT